MEPPSTPAPVAVRTRSRGAISLYVDPKKEMAKTERAARIAVAEEARNADDAPMSLRGSALERALHRARN